MQLHLNLNINVTLLNINFRKTSVQKREKDFNYEG